jgi:hypothetical protein
MKTLAIFILFALAFCQGQTVTEDLLAAQAELTLGHEFVEVYSVQSRQRLSNALELLEREILSSFMTAYGLIKNLAIETRQTMQEYENILHS